MESESTRNMLQPVGSAFVCCGLPDKILSLSGCHGDILNFTALSSITAYKPESISLEFDELDTAGQKESLPLKGHAFTAASALLLFTIMCFHKKTLQLPNGILHFVTPYTRS